MGRRNSERPTTAEEIARDLHKIVAGGPLIISEISDFQIWELTVRSAIYRLGVLSDRNLNRKLTYGENIVIFKCLEEVFHICEYSLLEIFILIFIPPRRVLLRPCYPYCYDVLVWLASYLRCFSCWLVSLKNFYFFLLVL